MQSRLISLASDLPLAGRIRAAGFVDQCFDVGRQVQLGHLVRRQSS
jgi:hypothetical protein